MDELPEEVPFEYDPAALFSLRVSVIYPVRVCEDLEALAAGE
jgi:hypothetical protein